MVLATRRIKGKIHGKRGFVHVAGNLEDTGQLRRKIIEQPDARLCIPCASESACVIRREQADGIHPATVA
jgi:hypothetical protein